MSESTRGSRLRNRVTLILTVLILGISLWLVGSRLVERVRVYQGDLEGAFAPILYSMVAAAVFFLSLLWAIASLLRGVDRTRAGGPVMSESTRGSRLRNRITLVLAVLILGISFLGFGAKFVEFVLLLIQGDSEGAFVLAPILNYLLAGAGFFLLLLWAIANGMFRDIERPKYTMLENERRLDHAAARRRKRAER